MKKSQLFYGFLIIVFVAFAIVVTVAYLQKGENFGHFEGNADTRWLKDENGDDRDMLLLADFTFVDARGREWKAPAGITINGSSIPQIFWSIGYSPFVGDHRSASIVHDYFCDTESRPWKDVHRIYYYASRVAGVSQVKAKLMYWAVYAGGPRWGEPSSQCASGCHETKTWQPTGDVEALMAVKSWIEAEDPSLEEIETRLNAIIPEEPHGGVLPTSPAQSPPAADER